MYLFFSHKLTQEQIKDAEENFKIKNFVPLPEKLQILFSNVPPELESLEDYLEPFKEFLAKNSKKNDVVLIQGDFGIVCALVEFSKKIGLVPVYATTKRLVKMTATDGKSAKISYFSHVRFRKY